MGPQSDCVFAVNTIQQFISKMLRHPNIAIAIIWVVIALASVNAIKIRDGWEFVPGTKRLHDSVGYFRTTLAAKKSGSNGNNYALLVMFNPSNGDGKQSDKTVNKVLQYIDAGFFNKNKDGKRFRSDINGLKIINIFSYQDSSPENLEAKLDKLKKTMSEAQAFKALNKGNTKAKWTTLAKGARIIVAAWGNCASRSDINKKKEEVANWLNNKNYANKRGYMDLTEIGNPTHPRGWNMDMKFRYKELPPIKKSGS